MRDLASAKRILPSVRMAVDDRRWTRVGSRARINQRVTKEVRLGDPVDNLKVEELILWDCVKHRVVALRAGTMAVGPR